VSRGFRNADETQAMSDQAVAQQIERILDRGRDDVSPATGDGRCADCGKEIGAERLAAVPTATRCISCQAEWEQGPGRR
jgi:phage/conjugal plasmid C-4 type zinc finger TraR family protein